MNVDGDIVDGGSNGEVLSDRVIGEEGVGWEVDEGDGVMNVSTYFSLVFSVHTTFFYVEFFISYFLKNLVFFSEIRCLV